MLWTLVRGISLKVGWEARPRRLVAARARKTPWMVTILNVVGGRSATEATIEPPAAMSRNQGAKIPEKRRLTGRRWLLPGWLMGPRGVPIGRYKKKEEEKKEI